MNIRRHLPAILLLSAAVAGARGILPVLSESRNLKPRSEERLDRSSVAERMARAEKTVKKASPFEALVERQVPGRESAGGKEQLDSVVGYNGDGTKYIRMYCVYGDDGLMTGQTNSYWDPYYNCWTHVQELRYDWNGDGLCTMMSNYSYGGGERMDYTYNAQGLCDVQIKYTAGPDTVWNPWYKGEYTYDTRGNMIGENGYLWDGTQWTAASRTAATYDENNLMAGIEMYECIDGVWRGTDKQEYVNYTANKLYDKYLYRWDEADGVWVNAQHFIQEWGPQGHLLAQRMRFWNADEQNWNGDYTSWGTFEVCKNYDAEMTYDDKWRITRQAHTDWYDQGLEKCLGSEMVTEWTDNADGTSQSEMNAYIYGYPDGSKIWNQRRYCKYDANDSIVWDLFQKQTPDGSDMVSDYERKYAYDDRGHLIYDATWNFEDGKRVPSIEERDFYDSGDNIIEQIFRMNGGGGGLTPFGAPAYSGLEISDEDNEGWVNTSRFTYGHENGVSVSKLRYTWDKNGLQWMPDQGSVVDFDFTKSASELILPLTYGDEYKINQIDNYTGDGSGGWNVGPQIYYWSGVSSVESVAADKGNALRFDGRILSVTGQADRATHRVYDLMGRLVLETEGLSADLGSLANGHYVVSSVVDDEPAALRILRK